MWSPRWPSPVYRYVGREVRRSHPDRCGTHLIDRSGGTRWLGPRAAVIAARVRRGGVPPPRRCRGRRHGSAPVAPASDERRTLLSSDTLGPGGMTVDLSAWLTAPAVTVGGWRRPRPERRS